MKSIKGGKWYIVLFTAVTGLAAGAATKLDGGYTDAALAAMGDVEGITLLGLALTDIMVNAALFCWGRISEGRAGKVMAMIALWFKAVLMGLFCRELVLNLSGLKALLIILTIFGGGCICVSLMMDGADRHKQARRMAVWLFGAAVEGIIIPSIARTCALLFK